MPISRIGNIMGVITKCYTYDISNNKSLFDFTVGLWYYIHASGTMLDGIAEVGYFACGAGGRRFEPCRPACMRGVAQLDSAP